MVGLGNPGSDYATSRHNVGFMVVDRLVERWGESPRSFQGKFGSVLMQSVHRGQRVHLQKPMEYMNLSGSALQRAMAYFRVEPARIVVIHDEIDLPYGRVRVKVGGGHGGHNGLRSISQAIGPDYLRVRGGVGRPRGEAHAGGGGHGGKTGGKDHVSGHVLGPFSRAEQKELPLFIDSLGDAVEAILEQGVTYAMNRFNGEPGQNS